MPAATGDLHRAFWESRARSLRKRINLGWWLQTLAAPLLASSLLTAAALLCARKFFPVTPALFSVLPAAGILCLVCAVTAWLASKKFESSENSLVRIEAALKLDNALSTARAGFAPWPGPREHAAPEVSWNWPRVLVPILGSLALLAAGVFLPISHEAPPRTDTPEPQAWRKISAELDRLADEKLADESYIEEVRQRLEDLISQQEDQWFGHSSLEATDALEQSHRAETTRAGEQLGQAEDALRGLQENPAAADRERLLEDFDNAMEGLRNGAMKPNAALLEQLGKTDLRNLGQIDPARLAELKDNLRKNSEALKQIGADGEAGGWAEELLGGADGEGGEHPDGEGGTAGAGGIQRGPGHDPDILGKQKDLTETGEGTPLESTDLSRALPGDLLELQDGEHQIDQSPSTMASGGMSSAPGKGGEQIWKQSLAPDEQRAFKKFYE